MKNNLYILFIIFLTISCSKPEIDISQTVARDGLLFKVSEKRPFSGYVIESFESGQNHIKTQYMDGVVHGTRLAWFPNGQKREESDFQEGKMIGEPIFWDESGNTIIFENVKLSDIEKRGDLVFKKGADNTFSGLATGILGDDSYKFTGKISYFNGKLDGKSVEWYANGQIFREMSYLNGIANGKWTGWTEDGNIFYKLTYLNGKLNGLLTMWHPNGNKLAVLNYENGVMVNEINDFHEDGSPLSITKLASGLRNGMATTWYLDGTKDSEIVYIDGNVNGNYTKWYPNGQIAFHATVRKNQVIDLAHAWDEGGNKLILNKLNKKIQEIEEAIEKDMWLFSMLNLLEFTLILIPLEDQLNAQFE